MTPAPIPYFDNRIVTVDQRAEVGDLHTLSGAGAFILNAYMGMTSADRLADTRHVYAYYRDIHYHVGGETSLDPFMGVPSSPAAIWNFVQPREIYLMSGFDADPHHYVVAACDCDWEREHGLTLVWRDGTTLCKVGPSDGHTTNVDAFDDPSMQNVVYPAIDARFRTMVEE